MRALVVAAAALLAMVVLGLSLAAQWTAQTYSYSEKLAGTAMILGFGVPVAVGFVWLAYDLFTSEDSSL